MAGTSIGLCGTTRLVVATTRTGSSASAASAVRTRWFSESCAVLGATRTSGASPGGSSISGWGSSKVIGPVTSTPAGQRRGYSSWGKVADQRQVGADPAVEALERRQTEPLTLHVEVAAALPQADVRASAAPPSRRRVRAAYAAAAGRSRRRADPARPPGRCGGSGSPAALLRFSAASDGASVRMSLTTACGRISSSSGSSARAASAAWAPSAESGSGGGTSGIPRPRRSPARRPRPPPAAPPRSRP